MDTAAARTRLQSEGVDVVVHRDGTLTASLLKPREQTWERWLRERVKALPGAVVTLSRERPAADPYLAHTEVRFVVGSPAMVGRGAGGRV